MEAVVASNLLTRYQEKQYSRHEDRKKTLGTKKEPPRTTVVVFPSEINRQRLSYTNTD